MCRNHSHLVSENLNVLMGEDGISVGLAQAAQELAVESSTGQKWIVPSGATLLIVVPSTASASSLANRVTAALAELLSTDGGMNPGSVGNTTPPTLSPASGKFWTN